MWCENTTQSSVWEDSFTLSYEHYYFWYLDSWDQREISNEDDAEFSGHVLHDRPALITKTCRRRKHQYSELGFVFFFQKISIKKINKSNALNISVHLNETSRLSDFILTLSDAEFDLEVDGGRHHRLGEDQDVLQTDHHNQVRKNLPAHRKQNKISLSFFLDPLLTSLEVWTSIL